MTDDMRIDLRTLTASDLGVEYSFEAEYSASILNGFYYRNNRQHPEYDYIMATLARVNVPAMMEANIAIADTLEKAFEMTAEQVKAEFENQLRENRSGTNTLNWWHRDYLPHEYVTYAKKKI